MNKLIVSLVIIMSTILNIELVKAELNDGLIAFYPFNGNANDQSGNENNGVVHGATLTTDRFDMPNSAYRFNGSENIIINNLPTLNSFTMAGWINWDSLVDWQPFLDNLTTSTRLETWNKQLTLSWNTHNFTIPLDVTTNKWYHLVSTYDSSTNTIQYYLNGVNIGSIIATVQVIQGTLYIGQGPTGANEFLRGSIDDVFIYSRVLSETEIQKIYHNEISLSSTVPGDSNGDGMVNVLDVISIINAINNNYDANFDCNIDGKIDILDVVCLINIITNTIPPTSDIDNDGLVGGADNCPSIYNPEQTLFPFNTTGLGWACSCVVGVADTIVQPQPSINPPFPLLKGMQGQRNFGGSCNKNPEQKQADGRSEEQPACIYNTNVRHCCLAKAYYASGHPSGPVVTGVSFNAGEGVGSCDSPTYDTLTDHRLNDSSKYGTIGACMLYADGPVVPASDSKSGVAPDCQSRSFESGYGTGDSNSTFGFTGDWVRSSGLTITCTQTVSSASCTYKILDSAHLAITGMPINLIGETKYTDIVSLSEDTYRGQSRVIIFNSSNEFLRFEFREATFTVLSETSFSRNGVVYDKVGTQSPRLLNWDVMLFRQEGEENIIH